MSEGKKFYLSAEALEQGCLGENSVRDGRLRVAAYIRVSTENPSQEDSYELQERYFTSLLEKNPACSRRESMPTMPSPVHRGGSGRGSDGSCGTVRRGESIESSQNLFPVLPL